MKFNRQLTKRIFILIFILLLSSSALAEKILFIGDSHSVGTYGTEINKLLSKDNTVRHYAMCGASPSWWFNNQADSCGSLYITETGKTSTLSKTPKLADLISDFQPTIVIITMGGNPAGKTPSNYDKNVASLVKIIIDQNIKCYWIGPPGKNDPTEAAQRDQRYEAIIKGLSNNCILIDSRDKVKLNKDEIHFSDNTRPTQWAQKVYDEISPGLKYGIMGDIYTAALRGTASATPAAAVSISTISSTPSTTTKITQPLCLNSQQCKEIDEAWASRISAYVNPDLSDKVYAVPGGWVPYTTLYTEPKSVQATVDTYVASTTKISYCGIANVGSPEYNALLDTIAWAEGGDYNVLYGGKRFEDLSVHPCEKQKLNPSASGRYQFTCTTYNNLKKKGLFPNFGKEAQDKAGLSLITEKGVSESDIKNAISSKDFIPLWDRLAPTWASLPSSSKGGKSYYGQPYKNNNDLTNQFLKCYEIQKNK
ncbi:hypothetical protein HYX11_04290 [Candidatus Woesearchaeota archaeon]|nr:hypothetical protein [Candidatus Woesearchaeota archaeon]